MFGLSKREKNLKGVETTMAYLLDFQGENFVRGIYKHYPRTKDLVQEKVAEGESMEMIASTLLRIVLPDQILRFLTPEQREQLAVYLRSDNVEELKKPPFALANLCRIFASALLRQSKFKKLDEAWVSDCIHDIYYAAKGLDADERSDDRVLKALDRALLTPRVTPPPADPSPS